MRRNAKRRRPEGAKTSGNDKVEGGTIAEMAAGVKANLSGLALQHPAHAKMGLGQGRGGVRGDRDLRQGQPPHQPVGLRRGRHLELAGRDEGLDQGCHRLRLCERLGQQCRAVGGQHRAGCCPRATAVKPQSAGIEVEAEGQFVVPDRLARRLGLDRADRGATGRRPSGPTSCRSVRARRERSGGLLDASLPEPRRGDAEFGGAAELVRETSVQQPGQVEALQFALELGGPAAGRLVGPDVPAKAALRRQRTEFVQGEAQQAARQRVAAGIDFQSGGGGRHLAVAGETNLERLRRCRDRQAKDGTSLDAAADRFDGPARRW